MEPSADTPPPLTAAPRHLRRRRLHQEIPDTLLVPGAPPVVAAVPRGGRKPVSFRTRSFDAAAKSYSRKRSVALGLMMLVTVSIVCLVLTLVLNA